jgi:hypothetical protein
MMMNHEVDLSGVVNTIASTTTTTYAGTTNKRCIQFFEWLPPELIATHILTRFCDAASLSNLACALNMIVAPPDRSMDNDESATGNHHSGISAHKQEKSATYLQLIVGRSVTARERVLLELDNVRGGQEQQGSTMATNTTLTTAAAVPYYSELLRIGGPHHSHYTTENDGVDEDDDSASCTIYRRLMVLDYCEHLPKYILWCGRMIFRDPTRPFDSTSGQLVQVMLLSDPPSATAPSPSSTSSSSLPSNTSWSIERVCAWNSVSQRSTLVSRVCNPVHGHPRQCLSIVMDSYRFLPIGPRGRLCGITAADRQALHRIGEHLNETDHVGTLLQLGRFDSSHVTSPFILRIVTYSGARRRLESALRPIDIEATDSLDSLLCFWESIVASDDDDLFSTISLAQKLNAIRGNLIEYKSFSSE